MVLDLASLWFLLGPWNEVDICLKNASWWLIRSLQGGPSGHGTLFVDINYKVPSEYKLLKL